MNEIHINPYISSTTYNLGLETSRSYIVNEESRNELMLEGISSNFWDVIIRTQNIQDIMNFANNNGLADEVDDFLCLLDYADVLKYGNTESLFDDILFNSKKMTLYGDLEQLNNFRNDKKVYLYNNKLLYALVIALGGGGKGFFQSLLLSTLQLLKKQSILALI